MYKLEEIFFGILHTSINENSIDSKYCEKIISSILSIAEKNGLALLYRAKLKEEIEKYNENTYVVLSFIVKEILSYVSDKEFLECVSSIMPSTTVH